MPRFHRRFATGAAAFRSHPGPRAGTTIALPYIKYPSGKAAALGYKVHRRTLVIEWGHCDPAGIVFNARYFEFFDWNTTLLFEAALGMRKTQWIEHFAADMPLVEASGRFLKPARYGDSVEIISSIGTFGRSSFTVEHQLLQTGELAVEAKETRVWVARGPDGGLTKSKPIPAEVIGALTA